eukprot:4886642-Amphidinium_carterae.1
MQQYIILTEKSLRQWTTRGTVPPQSYHNGTDDRHVNNNFHKQIERAIKDSIKVCPHNSPEDHPQRKEQFH